MTELTDDEIQQILDCLEKNNSTHLLSKQDIYKISPTRLMKTWINFANKQKSVTKEKRVLIILGYLGKHHVYSKTTTGAELLKKTLDIVLKNTNYTVTLKPHIITDNKQLIDILSQKLF